MYDHFVESSFVKPDKAFETPLRPGNLPEFIGQRPVKERLEVIVEAAKGRGEPLGHILFSGPPGLGKTTLAHILAESMGTKLVVTSGPVIEKAGDLAGLLTSLSEGDVLFIDEIHRLSRCIEEYLYPAMEDYKLDLLIDSGPSARTVQVKLNKFTLAGATTRLGLISSPLRSRFSLSLRLDHYPPKDLVEILNRTARLLKVAIDPEASLEIANRSRGTPRIANNLLKWVRDFAQVRNGGKIDLKICEEALNLLQIDFRGLDEIDKKILSVMIEHHQGGPVGLNTLAASIGEEPDTLEEVHEPYLICQGFIRRTPRGREATELAFKHLEKLTELPL